MKSEWKEVKLGDVCDVTMGQSPKSEFYNQIGEGIPFLQGNRTFGMKYPIFDTYTTKVTKLAKKNEVIMSVRAPVGALNITKENVCLGRGVCGLRHKNNNQEFLYYLLKYNVDKLIKRESGTVFGSVNKNDIESLEILYIDDEKEQKAISSILSALDDKIELNQQINNNLEQQAQAIFKFWFVDNIDPMWKEGTVSDLGIVVGGGTPSKAKPEYYTEHGIAWITPKDLSINKSKFILKGANDITKIGLKSSSAKLMPKGTVLFSSRAPIGYVAIAAGEVSTNQGFKSIIPKEEIGTAYVYYFLKKNLAVIESIASGSTFKEISLSVMKSIPAIIPDKDILGKFNDICKPIFKKQKSLEKENDCLAIIRDTLLPKFMSGK